MRLWLVAALLASACSSSSKPDETASESGPIADASDTATGGCPSEPDCYRATNACGNPCTVCRYCTGGVWTENGDDCHFSCEDTGTSATDVEPPVTSPMFNPAPGKYAGPVDVIMTTTTPGGNIHYTIDGTIPTASSPLYFTPVKLSSTTTLKAIAIYPWGESGTMTGIYDLPGDAGVYCGQLVGADGVCPTGCHRAVSRAMAPVESCTTTRYVCVSDASPDTGVILCRVAGSQLFEFSSGHAADPTRDPGWRECTTAEQSKILAAPMCSADASTD